ncbi:MAG: toxin-antitoxin system HicB family antitoxin [Candidatus Omnitrophica bacterium]|nr:toxin-antitoxin system HicB family antitoxin [Candidatus Omnitrophota bacterium]
MKKNVKKISCLSDKHCKGHLVLRRVDHTIKLKNKIVLVPNIEVWECDLCGERFFPYETSKKIDLYKEYSGRLMLRLEPELHCKLIRMAKKDHRSLNQEIHHLLEDLTEQTSAAV